MIFFSRYRQRRGLWVETPAQTADDLKTNVQDKL